MAHFDYEGAEYAIRAPIVRAHRKTWEKLASAGSFWRGRDRLEIARLTRVARARRQEPIWSRDDITSERLGKENVELIRTIAIQASKIDRAWAEAHIARLGAGAYVELGALVATITAIDTYHEALGLPYEPFPAPRPNDDTLPDEVTAKVTDIGAFVPAIAPWVGPNVSRALSLVPSANKMFMANVMTMYSTAHGGFDKLVWEGALSRPQAELLATKVSAINECFY